MKTGRLRIDDEVADFEYSRERGELRFPAELVPRQEQPQRLLGLLLERWEMERDEEVEGLDRLRAGRGFDVGADVTGQLHFG